MIFSSGILAFIPNPIISANESWFISNTEKVHFLFKKMNDVIEKVNSYDELFAELKSILAGFDETVRDEVEKYIREMYLNGELKDILKKVVSEYITDMLKTPSKSTTLDFARLFRKILNVGENNFYNTDNNQYTYMQGCVEFYHNNEHLCAISCKCSNHTIYRYNNNAVIKIYDMDTRLFKAEMNFTVGHCNSLAYDEKTGYLYIAWNYVNVDQTEASTLVRNVSRVLVDDIIHGVASSFATRSVDHGFNSSSTVACYNGDLFVGNRNKFCKFDFDNNIVEEIYELYGDDNLPNVKYIQDMAINNNYILLLSYLPSRLYLYDKETLEFLWSYNIPDCLNNHCYRVLEPEAITLNDNGDIYLFSGGHMCKKDFNAYDIAQVFKQNLYHNTVAAKHSKEADQKGRNIEVHLNHKYWAENREEMPELENPDGSPARPFAYPQEALNYIEDNPDIHKGSIVVHSDFGGCPWYICTYKNLFIYPIDELTQDIYMGSVAIEGCNLVGIRGSSGRSSYQLKVKGISAVMEHSSDYFDLKQNVIVCRNSVVDLSNVKIEIDTGSSGDNPRESSFPYTTYGLQGKYVVMNYSGDTADTSSSFYSRYGKTLATFTDSMINARGKFTVSNNTVKTD